MEKRKREFEEPKLDKRLRKLTIPKRVRNVSISKEESEEIKQDLNLIANTRLLQDEEYYECTMCGEKLLAPYPGPLKKLIRAVKKNKQEFIKEQEEEHKKTVKQCHLQDKPIPTLIYQKAGLSKNDQALICRMHKVELIFKPLAVKRGYPTQINFDLIDDRVKELKDELDDIIAGKTESEFLKKVVKAHEEMGSIKARQSKELIHRFTETLPGYYGNRGSHYMMESLDNLYLKSNILDKQTCFPLTPIEYIQQVLLPEVASRLIMKDMKLNNLNEAIKIMEESSEYGSIVYNKVKKK